MGGGGKGSSGEGDGVDTSALNKSTSVQYLLAGRERLKVLKPLHVACHKRLKLPKTLRLYIESLCMAVISGLQQELGAVSPLAALP